MSGYWLWHLILDQQVTLLQLQFSSRMMAKIDLWQTVILNIETSRSNVKDF